ncbi:Hypothetical predicted protein [Olea europaea subsp. europaea]|uniref:Uncharacterized protein n=1 Tax=Olea europaea subsp. europaea TaxID=158383 RepID=A0A8S0RPE6_OLEEU|nr:Hypothetical predicted protein [Olea europaea subsp. europaea]
MSDREEIDSDSGAREEFTVQQGIQQDKEIRRVQTENKARKWAEKLTPRPSLRDGSGKNKTNTKIDEESQDNKGILPDDIVQHIAANEKAVNQKKLFLSDSEDEKAEKNASRKDKRF